MGPDGSVVVRERVVRGVLLATSCGRPSPTRARRPSARRRPRRRGAAGTIPLQSRWPDVRAERVDRAACRGRARARSSRRALSTQNASSKRSRSSFASRFEPVGELAVAPDLARELGHAPLRVVDVALHLARRDRRLGDPAVGEALRVARVLPRLVVEPAVAAPLDTRRSRRRRGRPTRRSTSSARSAGSFSSSTSAVSSVQRQTSESSTR